MGKVLIYILTEGKGGVEEYVMNLSRFCKNASSKYGYLIMGEKTVYEEELKALGVDYYFVPQKKRFISNIHAYKELLKRLREEYDTIYFNTSGLYYPIPYIYAIKNKYRIIVHSHSTTGILLKRPLHYFNRNWINKACNVRMACSTPAGKWMFGNRKKFVIIPNAIELDRFCYDDSIRKRCREKYGFGNSFVIGNIGRLHRFKNQVFLVDILKAICDKGCDANLLIVGDGEMKNSIERHAEELGIRDKVVFTGASNKPEYFYSAMDSFVLPSFVEGFPITLIEAQANGLPCIVSDVVTKETNVSGRIHFLSLDDKPEVWANQLLKLENRYECMVKLKNRGYDVKNLDELVSEELKK